MFAVCWFARLKFLSKHKKAGVKPAFQYLDDRSGLHSPDMCIQAAFMARSLVFVDMSLAGSAIDSRYSIFVRCFCLALVATFDRFDHVFDVGAQVGTLAGIVLAMFFRLTGTFARL